MLVTSLDHKSAVTNTHISSKPTLRCSPVYAFNIQTSDLTVEHTRTSFQLLSPRINLVLPLRHFQPRNQIHLQNCMFCCRSKCICRGLHLPSHHCRNNKVLNQEDKVAWINLLKAYKEELNEDKENLQWLELFGGSVVRRLFWSFFDILILSIKRWLVHKNQF